MALVLEVDDRDALERSVEALDRGEVVIVPTDTVYGLAARAGAAGALFAVKERSADVPVAVLVADRSQAAALVDDLPPRAEAWIERHWPGPLTLVARRAAGVTFDLGQPADTIGVRCPDDLFLRRLAARVGPLATTSANVHGRPTGTTVSAIVDQFGDRLSPTTVVVDGGHRSGTPSTVVDVTGAEPVVLRPGPLDLDVEPTGG